MKKVLLFIVIIILFNSCSLVENKYVVISSYALRDGNEKTDLVIYTNSVLSDPNAAVNSIFLAPSSVSNVKIVILNDVKIKKLSKEFVVKKEVINIPQNNRGGRYMVIYISPPIEPDFEIDFGNITMDGIKKHIGVLKFEKKGYVKENILDL